MEPVLLRLFDCERKAVPTGTKTAFARLPIVGEFISTDTDKDKGYFEVTHVVHLLLGHSPTAFATDVVAEIWAVAANWSEAERRALEPRHHSK
jgi:hypothetical protein